MWYKNECFASLSFVKFERKSKGCQQPSCKSEEEYKQKASVVVYQAKGKKSIYKSIKSDR